MGWRDKVKLAGKPTKRFRVWRTDAYGKPCSCEGDYDTVEGLNAHRWKSDCDYKIQLGRRFMTRRNFSDWVRSNHHMVARETEATRVVPISIARNMKNTRFR